MKIELIDFLMQDLEKVLSLHRRIKLEEVKKLYPSQYVDYPEEDGTTQTADRNIFILTDSIGLILFEIKPLYAGCSPIIDMQGFTSSSESSFLDWISKNKISFHKETLSVDEWGESYQMFFPSGADALISRGEVHRIAKLF